MSPNPNMSLGDDELEAIDMVPLCFVVIINQDLNSLHCDTSRLHLFLMHVIHVEESVAVSFSWTQILKDNLTGLEVL